MEEGSSMFTCQAGYKTVMHPASYDVCSKCFDKYAGKMSLKESLSNFRAPQGQSVALVTNPLECAARVVIQWMQYDLQWRLAACARQEEHSSDVLNAITTCALPAKEFCKKALLNVSARFLIGLARGARWSMTSQRRGVKLAMAFDPRD